jgi:penicillin amidase
VSRRRCRNLGVRIRGPQDGVEVIRDRWGVPHIYAHNAADVCFAQGYVHAQDRLWQMDCQRRLASGRLAEVLGARALPVDRWLRILGFRRVAAIEAEQMPAEARREMEAYAEGVNSWIQQDACRSSSACCTALSHGRRPIAWPGPR